MAYLEGIQIEIKTSELKKRINEKVQYLLKRNIDRSGRGYFSPQISVIFEIYRKHIVFSNGETVHFSEIQEITEFKK